MQLQFKSFEYVNLGFRKSWRASLFHGILLAKWLIHCSDRLINNEIISGCSPEKKLLLIILTKHQKKKGMQEARKQSVQCSVSSFAAAVPPQRLFKTELLYLGAAEAEQVVTKDGSKNRSLAFSAAESGRSVLPLSHFSAGLTAQHLELWSFQPLTCNPFLLGHGRTSSWNTQGWYRYTGTRHI